MAILRKVIKVIPTRQNFMLLSALSIFFLYFENTTDGEGSPATVLYPDPGEILVEKCSSDFFGKIGKNSKPIYFVTPTYYRREQFVELNRLAQTLLHVKNLVWIVAEDSESCTTIVDAVLRKFEIPYVHLASPMPSRYQKLIYKPRGVANRNAGMAWIKDNVPENLPDGVLYFGDDDNTYDLRIFEEIRSTKKLSMFPVAFIGDAENGISSPIVGKKGNVIGFTDPWFANRKFPVDMAGFAVHTALLKAKNPLMPFKAGFEEDMFLQNLDINLQDIEPLADLCTKAFVFHTKTEKAKAHSVKLPEYIQLSIRQLISWMADYGMLNKGESKEDGASSPYLNPMYLPLCFKEKCPSARRYKFLRNVKFRINFKHK